MGRCAVSTQKQKRPFALRALAAFAGTLAILFVLLLAAYALPGERVRQHVYDSARTIQNEGLYPEYLGFKLFQMDNYTDTLMLFEAASADELPPLQAMMTNTAYNVDNFETLADDLAWYIEKDWSTGAQRTDAPALEPFSYARYWHGYLIWLRPLLLLMPYTGVRIVQYIVLFALLAVVLVQLRRRCGLRAAVWFAVSQLAVSVWFVPHQVQYFTCFMIAYAGCACGAACRSAPWPWAAACAGAPATLYAGPANGRWPGPSPTITYWPMPCTRPRCAPPPIPGTAWN